MVRWMDGRTEGQTDGQMDKWADGQMSRWTDRWTDGGVACSQLKTSDKACLKESGKKV